MGPFCVCMCSREGGVCVDVQTCLILACSTETQRESIDPSTFKACIEPSCAVRRPNCESMASQSFRSEKCSPRGVRLALLPCDTQPSITAWLHDPTLLVNENQDAAVPKVSHCTYFLSFHSPSHFLFGSPADFFDYNTHSGQKQSNV